MRYPSVASYVVGVWTWLLMWVSSRCQHCLLLSSLLGSKEAALAYTGDEDIKNFLLFFCTITDGGSCFAIHTIQLVGCAATNKSWASLSASDWAASDCGGDMIGCDAMRLFHWLQLYAPAERLSSQMQIIPSHESCLSVHLSYYSCRSDLVVDFFLSLL
jgi:hypothetical protein